MWHVLSTFTIEITNKNCDVTFLLRLTWYNKYRFFHCHHRSRYSKIKLFELKYVFSRWCKISFFLSGLTGNWITLKIPRPKAEKNKNNFFQVVNFNVYKYDYSDSRLMLSWLILPSYFIGYNCWALQQFITRNFIKLVCCAVFYSHK